MRYHLLSNSIRRLSRYVTEDAKHGVKYCVSAVKMFNEMSEKEVMKAYKRLQNQVEPPEQTMRHTKIDDSEESSMESDKKASEDIQSLEDQLIATHKDLATISKIMKHLIAIMVIMSGIELDDVAK